MNFDADPADERFRLEIRSYLTSKAEELLSDRTQRPQSTFFDRNEVRLWTQALDRNGLLVPHWPKENGGSNWQLGWRRILEQELSRLDCPTTDTIGTDFVGPVICQYGSPQQKGRYLPKIRSGEEIWCQGFSESHGGSDVMSIRTTAVRDKEHYVINGQKLWTSNAHNADMMFALLRIDIPGVRRQPGLSFMLLGMHSPGVTVRPIIMIDGRHWVNEVTLDSVRVPTANLVGEPGKGWFYARYLLTNERTVVAGLSHIKRVLGNLHKIYRADVAAGRGAIDPVSFRSQFSQLEIELQALEFMELRLQHSRSDDTVVQMLAPALKLRGSELRQRATELTMQWLGERALEFAFYDSQPGNGVVEEPDHPYAASATINYLFQRSATLAGGTSEIQRNIIAGIALQL